MVLQSLAILLPLAVRAAEAPVTVAMVALVVAVVPVKPRESVRVAMVLMAEAAAALKALAATAAHMAAAAVLAVRVRLTDLEANTAAMVVVVVVVMMMVLSKLVRVRPPKNRSNFIIWISCLFWVRLKSFFHNPLHHVVLVAFLVALVVAVWAVLEPREEF